VHETPSAAQRRRIARLAVAATAVEEESAELNVVPLLDVLTNLLLFVLATVAVAFTSTIALDAPALVSRPAPASLGLAVIVTHDGFSVKTAHGNVAPGCDGFGAGLAVPRREGSYDFDGLSACVAKVAAAAGSRDHDVTVSADPATPLESIVGAIDAIRTGPRGERSFDDVRLGVPR
jgi:biopolymer transport protein TolR